MKNAKKDEERLQNAVRLARKITDAEQNAARRNRPLIGVALGGGFARGIAHLGVLRVLEKEDHIQDTCIEVHRLENQADRQCRDLLATLFDEEKDAIQIIKWKEIIETLEFASDKCEDVANVIEGVTLKNA